MGRLRATRFLAAVGPAARTWPPSEPRSACSTKSSPRSRRLWGLPPGGAIAAFGRQPVNGSTRRPSFAVLRFCPLGAHHPPSRGLPASSRGGGISTAARRGWQRKRQRRSRRPARAGRRRSSRMIIQWVSSIRRSHSTSYRESEAVHPTRSSCSRRHTRRESQQAGGDGGAGAVARTLLENAS